MSFKELNLNISYNSDKDDILSNFYIPSLSESIVYKRIGGYFSSSSFALAARGLSKFILNNGHMQLLVSHILQKNDKEILEKMYNDTNFINEVLFKNFNSWDLENEIIKNHVMAFGWMIANGLLDLKIAITTEPEIFHQKVGIMIDNENNKLSFSGSNNETFSGWKTNIEEFKVFKSWISEQNTYLESDEEKFENFWSGKSNRFIVVDSPTAVKEKLIKLAPKNLEDIKIDNGEINKIFDFSRNNNSTRNIILHDFQKTAVKKWTSNNYKGILEMATGTGKTYTAFGCLNMVYKRNKKVIVVISPPQLHLIKQWENELFKVVEAGCEEDFDELFNLKESDIIALGSTNQDWKRDLSNSIIDFENGNKDYLVILCTHTTLINPILIDILKKAENEILLIADEVHGIGSEKRRSSLDEIFTNRLGLSATPERWLDEEGTKKIIEYFGETVFQFTIKDAISTINPITGKTFLTPYEYLPYFIELTQEEKMNYIGLSKKIGKLMAIYGKQLPDSYQHVIYQRANILKSAVNKIALIEDILKNIKEINTEISHVLIYCNPNDDQFEKVKMELDKIKLKYSEFTMNTGVSPMNKYDGLTEREYLLNKFSDGFFQILVAMKCLDEGVDIPSAKFGILMASSTNAREFIQRRGRLLRYSPNKNKSYIYDIIVIPPKFEEEDEKIKILDKNIYKKEMQRYKEFATIADNSAKCLLELIKAEEKFKIYE